MFSQKEIISKIILLVISFILFFIPFFWLQPGEVDLGGDASRLYFYDPSHYLQSTLLYVVLPIGKGAEENYSMFLPFVSILVLLKFVFSSSQLVWISNGLKLSIGFLSVFLIVKTFLFEYQTLKERNTSLVLWISIFCGLFYILSPITVRTAWDKAIMSHNQIFLNPLLFYLFLRFLLTNKFIYLALSVVLSFIFSTNFSWGGAPPFFTFFPLAFLYLIIYAVFVKKRDLSWKKLLVGFGTAIAVHAFHLVPTMHAILNKSGYAFSRAFTKEGMLHEGLRYFLAIAPSISLSKNFLVLPQLVPSIFLFESIFLFIPLVLVMGLVLNTQKSVDKQMRKNFLLLFLFFLFSVFLITANITNVGFDLYASLFYIPGFSMFRNFYGQWIFLYLLFLSILLGYSLFYIFQKITNDIAQKGIIIALSFVVGASALPFLSGDMVNLVLNKGQEKEFKIPIRMDPEYEKVLSYIRSDSAEGKYITFPFTESFYQMLAGTQKGMYQGPSMITHLTGKYDFSGYQHMPPFSELFLQHVKEKDNDALVRLFNILNISKISYNSDPDILSYFPSTPYAHVKDYLPDSQKEYKAFIASLPLHERRRFKDQYYLYELEQNKILPHIYIADNIIQFRKKIDQWGNLTEAFYKKQNDSSLRPVFVEGNIQMKTNASDLPKMQFIRVNPTKYYVLIENAKAPYALVFSQAFNPNWKLYKVNAQTTTKPKNIYFRGHITEGEHKDTWLDKSTFETAFLAPIAEKRHMLANAYANTWIITPEDSNNVRSYTLILELRSQRSYYISLLISLVSVIMLIAYIIKNKLKR